MRLGITGKHEPGCAANHEGWYCDKECEVTRDDIITKTIGIEGGFVDNPHDSGGATIWGITEALAREYGYRGNMEEMPLEVAIFIYTREFWGKIRGDDLLKAYPGVAEEVFDSAVNLGIYRAGTILQRSLTALNDKGQLYDDIEADGIIGSGTIGALRGYLRVRDPEVLLRAMNCLQGSFYIDLVERREKDEAFLYGWLINRVVV